jgi:hypothetical protein
VRGKKGAFHGIWESLAYRDAGLGEGMMLLPDDNGLGGVPTRPTTSHVSVERDLLRVSTACAGSKKSVRARLPHWQAWFGGALAHLRPVPRMLVPGLQQNDQPSGGASYSPSASAASWRGQAILWQALVG